MENETKVINLKKHKIVRDKYPEPAKYSVRKEHHELTDREKRNKAIKLLKVLHKITGGGGNEFDRALWSWNKDDRSDDWFHKLIKDCGQAEKIILRKYFGLEDDSPTIYDLPDEWLNKVEKQDC